MTEIDARTRENPMAGMLQQQAAPSLSKPDPKEREPQTFDSEAHRAFMRSLG